MKKTIFSLSLCLALLFGLVPPAYAQEQVLTSPCLQEINEFDLYNVMKSTPETELEKCGYSSEQIMKFKDSNFEELVYQRATLSDSSLEHMGYSKDEIDLLRNYDGSYTSTRALAGTLSAEIHNMGSSGSGIIVKYAWNWDHAPFVCATDAMGIRWAAIDDAGALIDVSATLCAANISYTYEITGSVETKRFSPTDKNFSSELNFNALTCNFPMEIGNVEYNPGYALSGSLTAYISRDAAISRDIYYLKICGVYGHTVINIGAPSVSLSPDPISVGISFTGGLNTDNIGIKKYRMYMDGRKVIFYA